MASYERTLKQCKTTPKSILYLHCFRISYIHTIFALKERGDCIVDTSISLQKLYKYNLYQNNVTTILILVSCQCPYCTNLRKKRKRS